MHSSWLFRTVPLAAVTLALASPALTAPASAAPVALVTDVGGAAPAGVDVFDELDDGSFLTIPAGGSLTFTHYKTCDTVTVGPGTLTLAASGFRGDGNVVSVQAGDCPSVGTAVASSQMGGVIMRAFGQSKGAVAASPRPALVLTGAGAGKVVQVEVLTGETVVLRQAVAGRNIAWPASAADLPEAGKTTLKALDSSGAVVATLTLVVTGTRPANAMTVIRIE